MTRLRLFFGLAVLPCAVVVACGTGDVLLGDDTSPDAGDAGGPDASGDARPLDDAATKPDVETKPDATPGTCASANGTCGPSSGMCKAYDDAGLTCPNAADLCCLVSCPELQQPPPSFCDGGEFVPTYAKNGCVNGFQCVPTTCAAAGGGCVALVPNACPSGHYGDPSKYGCGGGLGVTCCLP